MSEGQQRQLERTVIGGLLAIIGTMGLLLWNQQQGVIQTMSDRINRLEVSCKVDWPTLPSVADATGSATPR